MVKVLGFHDSSEPVIFMEYYQWGNIADAGALGEVIYISAYGQILSGLEHLHKKGIAHRDLKPENFLVEWQPFFRVAVSDFGLAKTVPDSALLSTFCGSLTYAAPEVFPQVTGHNHLVDIWSLGVIVLEWIYDIPKPPKLPEGLPVDRIHPAFWPKWIDEWASYLYAKLDDQEDCLLLSLLYGMLERRVYERRDAGYCLQQGLQGNLFRHRTADGLVVCADDKADIESVKSPAASFAPRESESERQLDDNANFKQ